MGFSESVCDGGLVLELGLNSSSSSSAVENNTNKCASLEPSLSLGFAGGGGLFRQESGSSATGVKREREVSVDHHAGEDDEEDGCVNGRKKLRLTKTQSALLEQAFKIHATLNPKQKQELARELKLRPRQVEVWFQNRRARTKLKQTETDCEYLKKCCEKLTDENQKLQKELQELKALPPPSLYMQLPAATLTMCPSCERVGDTKSSSKNPSFTLAKKPHFFNPFTNPSAAC